MERTKVSVLGDTHHGEKALKIKVEFDLTPKEFRAAMGWPDVSQLHEQLMDDFREKMNAGEEGYDPMSLLKPYLAQSAMTMEGMQKAVTAMMEGYFRSSEKK